MLTLKQIKNTIKTTLQTHFPSLEILSTKGAPTEVFGLYIELDNILKTNGLYNYERSMTVKIYLYPPDGQEGADEILDILEKLEEIFELTLVIENRHIKILETSSKIVDGVFQFQFNMNYHETKESNEDEELMQELKFK